MASIVLATVGRAVGTQIGGPVGGQIGASLGAQLGGGIGGGGGSKRYYEGARLEELAVQSSIYGRAIPILFGTMRLAGNVIWARPIKELQTTTTTTQSGGKGGAKKKATSTSVTYSYYATLAIAICEGEITRISRVWADAKLLDLSQGTYRIYKGSETQLADPLIESFQGVGNTPAYRGLTYVVIEDFPMGDFGNRIPNFTFEVVRHTPQRDTGDLPVESLVKSITLMPGSGEFVYDSQSVFKITGTAASGSFVQQGYRIPLNQHTAEGKANMLVAVDQLLETFPNLEWVSVVVNWFGSSTDIGTCNIAPRVEFKDSVQTTPDDWSVAGLTRATATEIGKDAGVARFGGTPDDGSMVRLITELHARGLSVCFTPLLMLDVAGKPWRGDIAGSSSDVTNFFTKTQGYNNFITHYANLLDGMVDAFVIGSELRGITQITSSTGVFPAVTQLVSLAATVKGTLGSYVKVTYAADWSEYHHAPGGWYHLDPLWSSSAIDVVGIDAYFPLSNAVQTDYDIERIRAGWTSGEGWDFYYTDEDRTITASLAAEYAWKNIAWWWDNAHVNPDTSTTGWSASSKPIWFMEYGFASVDGSTNEPSAFVDPSSSGSSYPRFSRGRIDFMAQRAAIAATEAEWAGSAMVQRMFLWTWDARPYPYWPDLRTVWADGANWATGHWVQGKLGASHVAAAVEQITALVGIDAAHLNISALAMMLDGFVIHERTTARGALAQLMQAYFFTLVEQNGVLVARMRDGGDAITITPDDCVPLQIDKRSVPVVLERTEDLVLPETVQVHYLNRLQRYETQVQSASRSTQVAYDTESMRLGLVLSETHARTIAEMQLVRRWAERSTVTLQLPMAYGALQPGDVLSLQSDGASQYLRIEQVQIGRPGIVRIRATLSESEVWDGYIAPLDGSGGEALLPPADTQCEILDIPALPGDLQDSDTLRIAAAGVQVGWTGASVIRESEYGEDLLLADVESPAVMGACLDLLDAGSCYVIDRVNTLDVALLGEGELSGVSEAAMLDGANVALVGDEIIQFSGVEALGDHKYRLSTLLRGRLGTEAYTASHSIGERFVMLDGNITSIAINPNVTGQGWSLRAVTYGALVTGGTLLSHIVQSESLKPYGPVHLAAWKDAGGVITLKWVRRVRIDGAWRDGVDVPLMEQREEYEVRVMSGSSILRSWRATSNSQVYTGAEQIADFGSSPTNVTLAVAQISALVGLGHLSTQTVTVDQ
jgi:hypothetical protein